ncbi:MAG: threonine/serine exporter family protein [Defluviitaleaceae bacterium]|nr:threonine/serine exporter family protein [Defluviitaleaceae bacterium]
MIQLTLIIQTAVAFAATFTFSMIFNIPGKELLFCGITGAAGWFVSRLMLVFVPGGLVLGTFAGTLVLTFIGRCLSYARKTPVLVYLIGGILPLVPGAGIYYTMYEFIIENDTLKALELGIETAKITGVIAIGIICVLSLPRIFFIFGRKEPGQI